MADYKCENVLPYDNQKGKTEQVEQMFDNIAGQYDPMNRIMSLGNDRTWRKKAIETLKSIAPKRILDVATGTGDFAIAAQKELKPQEMIGIDLSEKMLEVGRKKLQSLGLSDSITLQKGDSTALDFEEGRFDAVTVAFGVRNFESLQKGLSEINRVLRKGGAAAILELSEPTNPIYKLGYKIYTGCIIPIFARLLSKDTRAYSYLPDSIEAFPEGEEMKKLLLECGFSQVTIRRFTFGTCSFYYAIK
ncbi:MAG: bifunctional demethylmenaquinone methyltransferase/2-methoxy-6-polyprenyl-1,4-benzoquinol methylase UbiE [Paludibacteraceae bacterium]|nr:bifunctional demethylmenaquinone methyltransferase/2-methoxy-6-polyprenyl-1,4-benzoquinol methylase UbiE [Paludibacteraceae bacterium]